MITDPKKKKHFPILKISHCSLTHGNVLFYSSFLSTTLGRIGYGINNFQPTCYRFYLAGIIQTRASTTPYTKHVQTSNATVCEKNEALTGPPTHPFLFSFINAIRRTRCHCRRSLIVIAIQTPPRFVFHSILFTGGYLPALFFDESIACT